MGARGVGGWDGSFTSIQDQEGESKRGRACLCGMQVCVGGAVLGVCAHDDATVSNVSGKGFSLLNVTSNKASRQAPQSVLKTPGSL